MERLTRTPRGNLPVSILAIGAGGLQRALTHECVDELNRRGNYRGGIFVGQPRGREKAEAFNRQSGLYHVVTFDLEGVKGIRPRQYHLRHQHRQYSEQRRCPSKHPDG